MTDQDPSPSNSGPSADEIITNAAISTNLPVDEHVEEVSENGQKVRRKGVYLLPNLITTAALFSGFYAIISGINGNFDNAAIAIFIAGVLDGFDGRVARMTNTTSAFGVQYDSLSDMVSFGVAPSIVMFGWGLESLGKFGWAAAFIYTACAAMRLARFNTQVGTVDKRYFIGLASPAAAGVIASTIWLGSDQHPNFQISILLAILTALVGLLMVSNIRYNSFKGLGLKGRVPFVAMLVAVIGFAVIATYPAAMLLMLAGCYALSGPFFWFKANAANKIKPTE